MFYYQWCSNILEFKRSSGDILIKFQPKVMLFGARARTYCPFIFQLQMKFATLLAAIHCFSHKHILFIFNMYCLLTALFYLPFVVDAFSLGSQCMNFFWMNGRGFFLYCLIIFLNDQLQINNSSHFTLNFDKCCILWHTDICRTVLV